MFSFKDDSQMASQMARMDSSLAAATPPLLYPISRRLPFGANAVRNWDWAAVCLYQSDASIAEVDGEPRSDDLSSACAETSK